MIGTILDEMVASFHVLFFLRKFFHFLFLILFQDGSSFSHQFRSTENAYDNNSPLRSSSQPTPIINKTPQKEIEEEVEILSAFPIPQKSEEKPLDGIFLLIFFFFIFHFCFVSI